MSGTMAMSMFGGHYPTYAEYECLVRATGRHITYCAVWNRDSRTLARTMFFFWFWRYDLALRHLKKRKLYLE